MGSKPKPKPKPTPWGGGDQTGAGFKAALLSGPPGVGKTTAATLVCQVCVAHNTQLFNFVLKFILSCFYLSG